MQFKHPEILYALFLLIVPIIVHLFQLQRFTKIPFTNVAFLKKVEQQTRKSAKLKKWLVLLTRLLTFACIIFAFSQPYISKEKTNKKLQTIIYLDNSFSMQSEGNQGTLLKTATKKIVELGNYTKQHITVITNNNLFTNTNLEAFKKELLTLDYTPTKTNLKTIFLKINEKKNEAQNIVLVSDFQNTTDLKTLHLPKNTPLTFVKLVPKSTQNFYIDSVYLQKSSATEIILNTIIKSSQNSNESVAVSLFNNNDLYGKATAKFLNSKTTHIEFTISNEKQFLGKILIDDEFLPFDNSFYFTISKLQKIAVLSIGKSSVFLPKIYTEDEFLYQHTTVKNLKYNAIQKQQLIVLNEVDSFPKTLITHLQSFLKNGGYVVIIPSEKINIQSYNNLFNKLSIGTLESAIQKERKITSINYNHPLLKNVFEKKVTNFQYPKTHFYFKSQLNNALPILKFDDNTPFISSFVKNNGNIYWISSPLNTNVTNFTKSPIIVPIFYNFAKTSLKTNRLYYTIASKNIVDIKTHLKKDRVLNVSNNNTEFIPLQQIFENKVVLTFENNIPKSGFYNIKINNELIKTIAFNYNREESVLLNTNLKEQIKNIKHATYSEAIETTFNKVQQQTKIDWLFKCFLALSVLFLFIEMLILKYFKV